MQEFLIRQWVEQKQHDIYSDRIVQYDSTQ